MMAQMPPPPIIQNLLTDKQAWTKASHSGFFFCASETGFRGRGSEWKQADEPKSTVAATLSVIWRRARARLVAPSRV